MYNIDFFSKNIVQLPISTTDINQFQCTQSWIKHCMANLYCHVPLYALIKVNATALKH